MDLPLSANIAGRLIILDEIGSTNDELASRAASEPLAEFTVVATTHQTAGRGRLGRTWVAPAGTSLAASVLLRPVLLGPVLLRPESLRPELLRSPEASLDRERFGWIPLIAGLAMSRAVSRLVPEHTVSLKWPNDVLIDGKKVCGVLSELLPDGSVIVGSGVNLTMSADALPVPTATSLLLMGAVAPAEELADLVLAGYLGELRHLWNDLTARDPSADIHDAVSDACSTLGQPVRVSFPDGIELVGVAESIDDVGRLQVRPEIGGSVEAVAAGDVTHLRYE